MTTSSSALLILHLQRWVLSIPSYPESKTSVVLDRAGAAIAFARGAGIPVVYVQIAFRRGGADISARNALYSRLSPDLECYEGDAGIEMHDSLAPEPGDVLVVNRRISAFAGSDLDLVLRSMGATHLVMCGIGTGGVVLSTFREAADRDFELTVLADACADSDDEIQSVLLGKVFPRQGEVLTVDEWIADPAYSIDRIRSSPVAVTGGR